MVTTDVGVLDKVMAILALFDDRTDSLDPTTAARATGMSTPTAYRLMKAMAAQGLLVPSGRGYGLGLRLLHLGHLAAQRLDIVAVARPHMVRLREECNETVELQVREGHSRVPVHLEASTRTVRAAAQVGVPLPVHKGASARPILAWLPEDRALALARASAAEAGDELDEGELLERLATIRRQGYDIGYGERDVETGAGAAPIFDRSGEVVALLVASGTRTRFKDAAHRRQVADGLRRTAAAITEDLGGSAPR
ncbi:IclR family transcriptional regulator [Ornithinimicrobium tianjinense]|uniref:IclR family transcriptional regulator n=1 Tax=Ornithinimicrobium tianjinense TaxID=1195761 RepID=A0A917F474_9MICO|nr:IclR family transcriptional regulator [Ornithinimicrobium tianjinense]GGF40937.1 IclR family transcriptional regulator [Ornithinimicrobium tianjinense]